MGRSSATSRRCHLRIAQALPPREQGLPREPDRGARHLARRPARSHLGLGPLARVTTAASRGADQYAFRPRLPQWSRRPIGRGCDTRRVTLERPIDRQPHYGQHLGDPAYWQPYVEEVLGRHALPADRLEAPFVGTFPTFIVGDVVVKLFGPSFDGERSSRVETAMHLSLEGAPDIP